jgi:HD-like signal output (HDOD) protein/tRNA A-37 threonylcarbamoyl transferase component Bud32
LHSGKLPTPPAVALEVVNIASRPDCDPKEIVAVLARDPALCGKLLKAVNSCLYGLKQPVSSVAKAVQVLGLSTVRSLSLGLSLPAVKTGRASDQNVRDYWISSVGGAIIARELSALGRRPGADDDLVAGLLRDLGEVLLQQAFASTWADHLARNAGRLVEDPCGAEFASFGIDHADVSAELLRLWNLPDEIVEPIRFHHRPELLASAPKGQRERAELLHFASQLVHLDAVAQRSDLLEQLLATARDRFKLPQQELVEFLQKVAPKVEAFASVLNQEIGHCPDFAAILAAGAAELVNLTVENSRKRLSGTMQAGATVRVPASRTMTAPLSTPPMPLKGGSDLPEFRPEFVEALPEGGCRLGNYELQSLLGRGAMGVVFKAYEPSLHRHVAIKMLAPELATSKSAHQRFLREARTAAAIQHENVVAIYAVREVAGVSYLAMEYVNGSCLESRVQQHGAMPVMLLVATARQIAAGLAAAHARNIIHRDIKPANILIEHESGRAKLGDFGLARVSDDATLTAEGALIGTPFYMAPEVIHGEPATPASDLFSLGGVVYMMATGRVPFPGQTMAAVLNAVTSREPTPPAQMRGNLPGWLGELILRLLKKNPAERFPSASAVAAALADCGV